MRIFKAIMTVLIVTEVMICTVYASSESEFIYEYPIQGVTVEFSEGTTIPQSRRQDIADFYAGEMESIIPMDEQQNIICTLFGHDLSTSTVTVTRHRVRQHEPRCQLEIYDVEACSRCDYTVDTLFATSLVFCHPEDQIN